MQPGPHEIYLAIMMNKRDIIGALFAAGLASDVDGKLLCSFSEEFERWIEAGGPGITHLEFEGLASLLK